MVNRSSNAALAFAILALTAMPHLAAQGPAAQGPPAQGPAAQGPAAQAPVAKGKANGSSAQDQDAAIATNPLSILYFDVFYTLGYRFVDVHGSRDRFDTDFNLKSGFRLTELRFDGRFEPTNAYLDRVELESFNLADPYQRIRGEFEKEGLYRASADYRRSRYKYRASGDYHRVDRKEQVASYDIRVPLDSAEVFAGFARTHLEGFYLTNRIGNRNLSPQTSIDGVTSPRRVVEDEAEIGVALHFDETTLTVAGEYVDHNENNRWSYSQPATANPGFTESDDASADSSLEGPGARLNLSHHAGPLDISIDSRLLDRRRRIVGRGTGTGFDTAAFNSSSTSIANGSSRTILADGTLSYEFDSDLVFHSELRYLDHAEHLFIDQTDTTVYPSIPTTVTVGTLLDQRTTSRLREASAGLDWQPHESLILTGGWGWSQEKLALPDLEGGDQDFARGTVREDGFLVGAQWRPDAHWTARTRYRDFGQGGLQLHEIVDRHTRGLESSIDYRKDALWGRAGVDHHRSQNPIADSRTSNTSYVLSGGYAPSERLDWYGSYTLSDIDSRTRTNFYFDPSPTPVPTLVGFHGESQTLSTGLDWHVTERLRAALMGNYTTVHGDFELDLYHWSVDLSMLVPRGRWGVKIEQVDYHEAGNPDDYDAWMTYLYFATEIRARTSRR